MGYWYESANNLAMGMTHGLYRDAYMDVFRIHALKTRRPSKEATQNCEIDLSNWDALNSLRRHMTDDLGGDLVGYDVEPKSDTPKSMCWVWVDAVLYVDINGGSEAPDNDDDARGNCSWGLISTDFEFFAKIRDFMLAITTKPKIKQGSVYALMSQDGDLRFRVMGLAGTDFEPSNYTPEVVTAFQHVVADVNNKAPCGRLSIIDGYPGTGKTFLIRSLLNMCPGVVFGIVSSNLISDLSGPNFLPTLASLKRGHTKPIVLILEDADACLVSRERDNLDAISGLLNLSDGILGALTDLRIICTTNQTMDSMDDAVMRPGRLCRRIEVGLLDQDQAAAIYKRLKGADYAFEKGFYSLAQVYLLANTGSLSSGEVHKNKRRAGFGQ